MHVHDIEYCTFREVKTVVVTWNAGASTPTNLQHDEGTAHFLREVLQAHEPPEILVFGFQELVDLDDKKLTASKTPLPKGFIQLVLKSSRKLLQRFAEEGFIRARAYESTVSRVA